MADRNAIARDTFIAQQKRQHEILQFTQAMAAGTAGAIDRFGKRVEVGQYVLYHSEVDLVFEVKAIAPVVDPMLPVGLVRLSLECTVPVTLPANQRQIALAVCREPEPHAVQPPPPDTASAPATEEGTADAVDEHPLAE